MYTTLDFKAREHARFRLISPTTVTINSAYSTGQVLGTVLPLIANSGANTIIPYDGLSTVLNGVVFFDSTAQSAAIDLFFFKKAIGTYTDKTTFTPSAADMLNCTGVVQLPAASYIAAGSGQSIITLAKVGLILKPATAGNTTMYCVPVVRGTPTYTTAAMQFTFDFSEQG